MSVPAGPYGLTGLDDLALLDALVDLHRCNEVGALVPVDLPASPRLDLIIESAGFAKARAHAGQRRIRRLRTLADSVAGDLELLIVGLNPSPASADSGVPFHRPGNRFWPAMLQAGLATVDRDPELLLAVHHIGMTDIVKRTTRRADEVSRAEFRSGMRRVEGLVEWLAPEAVCFVGLGGWRAAVDPKAGRGWQTETLGGRPVYVMPSTSGLNAHDTVDSLAEHLRAIRSSPTT